MITLNLDPKLEQQVSDAAKVLGLSKSELIRKCLISYIEKIERQNPWETGQDLFGRYSSGRDNLSSNRKTILKDKLTLSQTMDDEESLT